MTERYIFARQVKRRKNIPVLPFSQHSELPCMVPEGERWSQCIANRAFKTRVIDLVLLRLPGLLLTGRPNRRLVVDYQQPVEYRFEGGTVRRETLEELPALGEADLKFARFADRFGKLLVDSIDGDSIPIALMHHELCLRRATPPPLMSVYRMELNRAPPAASGKKREAPGADTTKPAPRAPRTYEYVSIHALYEGLRDAIAQGTGRIRMPTHAGHEITMLIALIALTGTDFSRNLPQMSGRTVFSWLPDIWPALMQAYLPDGGTVGRLEQTRATDQLVALLYRTKFPKHVGQVSGASLQAVLAALQGSSISDRVKQSLPSYERVACTVRNANWVLAYWTCEPAPDPIQPEYGFRLLPGGCTEYADA